MKFKWYYLAIGFSILTIIFYSLPGEDYSKYIRNIQLQREQNINALAFNADSKLFNIVKIESFDFFEPDPKYRIEGRFIEIGDKGRVTMATNTGEIQDYIRFGAVEFEIENHLDTLYLFIEPVFNAQAKFFFIPFNDLTNGSTTYEAGRYMNVKIQNDQSIILDFNLAYNPYCTYTPDFSCPIPPKENFINFKIEAGEKKYKVLH